MSGAACERSCAPTVLFDENRAETIKVLLQWVKQTPEIAGRSYDVELKSILRDGTMTDAEMESFIDRLGNEKKRSIDEVRDFSFCPPSVEGIGSGEMSLQRRFTGRQ